MLSFFATLTSISSAAMAQPVDASDILVTASRTGNADNAVTGFDQNRVDERQPGSLLELLGDLPGVRAYSTGGPGGTSVLSIRGGEANFTSIMLDGVRLNDPTNVEGGAFDFNLLDPQIVERVEVVRSATSAIHGSDALSGVVQIVTAKPSKAGPQAGANIWFDSRYGGAVSGSISGGWASGGMLVSAGHYDSGDEDPAGDVRRDQLFVKARQAVGGFALETFSLFSDASARGFPQDSGGSSFAINRTLEIRDNDLQIFALRLLPDIRTKLRPHLSLNYTLQHGDSDTPAIAPGILNGVPAVTAQTRLARLEASGHLVADIGPLTLSAGASILRENGRSSGTLDFGFPLPVDFALTRVTHAGFAEGSWRVGSGLTLNGAVRYDRLRGSDGNWTGRADILWSSDDGNVEFFARVGTGFKQPSLYALGHPLIGDPALKPERSRSLEAGMTGKFGQANLGLTIFDNRFRNLIDFDPVIFRLTNRSRVETRGVELYANSQLGGGFFLDGALTFLSTESPTKLRGRPRWSGNLRGGWEYGRWQILATARSNSAFFDSSIPTGLITTPGHIAVDVGGAYRLNSKARVRLTLRNLGDEDYQDAVGVLAPGRSLRLSLIFE